MKKRALTLFLALVMCLSLCTPAMAEEKNQQTVAQEAIRATAVEPGVVQLSNGTQLVSTDNCYYFVDESLRSPSARSGSRTGTYLYSYYSHVSDVIVTYNSKDYINSRLYLSLPAGSERTITKTLSITGTLQFTASVNSDLKQAIAGKLGATSSFSLDASLAVSETFKNYDSAGRTLEFYYATGFNLYGFTYKRYDVYLGDGGSSGLGTGNETVYNGTIYTEVHVPKVYRYSVYVG